MFGVCSVSPRGHYVGRSFDRPCEETCPRLRSATPNQQYWAYEASPRREGCVPHTERCFSRLDETNLRSGWPALAVPFADLQHNTIPGPFRGQRFRSPTHPSLCRGDLRIGPARKPALGLGQQPRTINTGPKRGEYWKRNLYYFSS